MQAYFAVNKDNNHWITVVMHTCKKEFQVLDSLMGRELSESTRKLVEDFVSFIIIYLLLTLPFVYRL